VRINVKVSLLKSRLFTGSVAADGFTSRGSSSSDMSGMFDLSLEQGNILAVMVSCYNRGYAPIDFASCEEYLYQLQDVL
jgi:hypothetical protein